MVARSQDVAVSSRALNPVAFVAAQLGTKITPETGFVQSVQGAQTALDNNARALSSIGEIKRAIGDFNTQQVASGGGSHHVLPEADRNPFSIQNIGIDLAVTAGAAGAAFIVGAPIALGVAAAGVGTAIRGAVASFSSSPNRHAGTLHAAVDGGGTEFHDLGEKKSNNGGYVDVLGGRWDGNTGTPIKVAQNIGPATPSPFLQPSRGKQGELESAVAEANHIFTPSEMQAALGMGKEERELLTQRGGLLQRLDQGGFNDEGHGREMAGYDRDIDFLRSSKPAVKAPNFHASAAAAAPAPASMGMG